jgi:hypothetical protein
MAQWLAAGYFKQDLPIKAENWNDFYPLGMANAASPLC